MRSILLVTSHRRKKVTLRANCNRIGSVWALYPRDILWVYFRVLTPISPRDAQSSS